MGPEKTQLTTCRVVLIEPDANVVRSISQNLGDHGAATALISNVPLAVKLLAEKPGWADIVLVGPSVTPDECKGLVASIRERSRVTSKALPLILVAPFRNGTKEESVLPHWFDAHVPVATDARQLVGAIQRVLVETAIGSL